MSTRMLIDARHPEETRVAVVKSNRIEELDFESAEHKQLKGNIYLAKVTRVEPSLQAAFVDYGGNRHGFLAFSEIHPDYYQIPKEDRDRLLAEDAAAAAEEAALREQEEAEGDEPAGLIRGDAGDEDDDGDDLMEVDSDTHIDTIDVSEGEEPSLEDDDGESEDSGNGEESEGRGGRSGRGRRRGRGGSGGRAKASDAARAKRIALKRRYKIQDVIHRRQVLLVQVVKEERGNKGAALTTYLSLAGRYCVLMPNTSHGGGISRKISNAGDRKRLKSIVADLKLPQTMGCIIRTAGLSRTKAEIKRDFDYLARLWDEIRERTLKGAAPMLIHSDSDLIKRAIRDIYNRDISEVIVEGDEGYRAAKDFMKLLMPSHSRRVKQYADPVPLFQRYGVEDQLAAMYNPVVQLKSGGYIVINPTEALVSIDINSGRSTREHGIEQTALSTNLEAAREIARQLRLRDMAGLVVIDFIDMDHHSNNRKVEREMKAALKNDRARIQVGRISSFGLMEMSRQRLRTGVLEASTRICPHCEGTGLVRTASSSALLALRLIEEEAARGQGSIVRLSASQEACFYVLNQKRTELASIEERYGVSIEIVPNDEAEGAKMVTDASGPRPDKSVSFDVITDDDEDEDDYEQEQDRDASDEDRDEDGSGRSRRKRRRRGRRGGRNRGGEDNREAQDEGGRESERPDEQDNSDENAGSGDEVPEQASESEAVAEEEQKPARKRPARRRKRKSDDSGQQAEADAAPEGSGEGEARTDEPTVEAPEAEQAEAKPKRTRARRPRKKKDEGESSANEAKTEGEAGSDGKDDVKGKAQEEGAKEEKTKPSKAPEKAAAEPAAPEPAANDENGDSTSTDSDDEDQTPRKGWWQRTFG